MTLNSRDARFNELIKQLFNREDWHKRAEAARKLGFLKDNRAVNLLWRAIRSEREYIVINQIIEAMGRIGNANFTMSIIDKLKEELKKETPDKFRIIFILESLTKLKDKRALVYIGQFLNSNDEELKKLAKEAFDYIEPNWREILKKKAKDKTIQEIFDIKS